MHFNLVQANILEYSFSVLVINIDGGGTHFIIMATVDLV